MNVTLPVPMDQLLSWSPQQRVALYEALRSLISPAASPVDEKETCEAAWIAEAERRFDAGERGEFSYFSGPDSILAVREHLAEMRR